MASDHEVLSFAVAHGMIDLDTIQRDIEMKKRTEILNRHPYHVWQNENDGRWYTYLSADDGKQVLKSRKDKTALAS